MEVNILKWRQEFKTCGGNECGYGWVELTYHWGLCNYESKGNLFKLGDWKMLTPQYDDGWNGRRKTNPSKDRGCIAKYTS
jgi:hypothetical protein